jgi:hypothetical protein
VEAVTEAGVEVETVADAVAIVAATVEAAIAAHEGHNHIGTQAQPTDGAAEAPSVFVSYEAAV